MALKQIFFILHYDKFLYVIIVTENGGIITIKRQKCS